jgi:hypothetical protein
MTQTAQQIAEKPKDYISTNVKLLNSKANEENSAYERSNEPASYHQPHEDQYSSNYEFNSNFKFLNIYFIFIHIPRNKTTLIVHSRCPF